MRDKQLADLFDAAAKNKKALKELKSAAISANQYELAAYLREIEKKNFPESEEVKTAKAKARELNVLFRLVELNIPDKTAWLIAETVKRHNKRKGNFDMKDAAKLLGKVNELFS